MPTAVLFEAQTSVSATFSVASWSAIGGVSASLSAPTNGLAGLAVSPVTATVSLVSTQQSVTSAIEVTQGARLALPVTSIASALGLSVAVASAYSALQGLAAQRVSATETLVALAQSLSAAYSAQTGLTLGVSASYAALQQLTLTQASPFASARLLSMTTLSAFETLAALAVNISGAAYEAAGVPVFTVLATYDAATEALAQLVLDASSALASVQALTRTLAGVAQESAQGVAQALRAAPLAWRGYLQYNFSSEPAWTQGVLQELSASPYASTGRLSAALARSDIAHTGAVARALALAASEALGYVPQRLTSAFEAQGTAIEAPPYDVEIDRNVLDVIIEFELIAS